MNPAWCFPFVKPYFPPYPLLRSMDRGCQPFTRSCHLVGTLVLCVHVSDITHPITRKHSPLRNCLVTCQCSILAITHSARHTDGLLLLMHQLNTHSCRYASSFSSSCFSRFSFSAISLSHIPMVSSSWLFMFLSSYKMMNHTNIKGNQNFFR